jgi:hypothetical protein
MTLDRVDPEGTVATPTGPAHAGIVCPPDVTASDHADAMIDEWGRDSFPASDPPSNW